jgi:hypothetical protein
MEFETIPTPLDLSTKEKKEATVLTDESFADLSFIRLGAGAQSIILDIQTGLHIGALTVKLLLLILQLLEEVYQELLYQV